MKLVQLVHDGKDWKLVRAILKEIVHSGDSPLGEREKVAAVRELLKGIPVKNSKFVISLNSSEMNTKVFTVPPMPKRELKEVVVIEAKRDFSFSVEDSILDFEEEEIVEKGAKKYKVTAALCPKKVMNDTLALLKQAGLLPVSVIPSSYALKQLMEAGADSRPIQCVLEMGDVQSEFLIFKEKRLVFYRKFPFGGQDFTRALIGVFASERGKIELSWSEAETIKRQVGLSQEGMPMASGKISSVQLHSMLRSSLEQLTNEIERGIDYYHEQSGEERVSSLVLYGRGAYLKGLPSFLSEALGVEVELGSPLKEIKLEAQIVIPEEGFSHFATALGTALTFGKGLNLLPPEIKEEIQRTIQRATLQSTAAAVLLIFIFFYVGLRIHINNLEKRIAVAQMETNSLQFDLGELNKVQWARGLSQEQPYWEDVLKELGNRIPRGIALTNFTADTREKKITLQGLIRAPEKEAILSAFIQSLEAGIFDKVRLIKAEEKPEQDESQFQLQAWVNSSG